MRGDRKVVEEAPRVHNPVIKKHLALFKMVLSAMHGDLKLPADQPNLQDLAAVCAELTEMECDPKAKLNPGPTEASNYDLDRTRNNKTPVTLTVPRDILTPPSTPVMSKMTDSLHYGVYPTSSSHHPTLYAYYPRNA